MIRPRRVVHAREIMDEPDIGADELERSLAHVAGVNRWLGGTRALIAALRPLLQTLARATVLDVGSGSGDLPLALADWGRRNNTRLNVTAVDLHPLTVRIGHRRTAADPAVAFARADALALPFPDRAFDFALLTLTLHHFEGEAQEAALCELVRVARCAVIVSELERCWANYIGARALAATIWHGNRITRHDGPLSVLRAFTASELLALGRRAGLSRPRLQRRFFHRLVLVGEPAP